MTLVGPAPLRSHNPVLTLIRDVLDERAINVPYPPGETRFSPARTRRFFNDPLPLLLELYERYGPVFTLRLFHINAVFMLGPEASHYITVSNASNFTHRESFYRDLAWLMGDGLFTIDGAFHRNSRQVMLPAFHRERIAASADMMVAETTHALDRLTPGAQIDLHTWIRHLTLRISLCTLLGLDPDGETARTIVGGGLVEKAVSYYAADFALRTLRGPYTPWARMQQAVRSLDELVYAEISSRRRTGVRGEDILSLLLDAQDEDGHTLTDLQIRDQVITLIFAGHGPPASTIAFMFWELSRHPQLLTRLLEEQDALLVDGRPTAAQLMSGELSELEMTLEETLRKYPPAWFSPRHSVEPFEFAGHSVPGGAFVNYSSWASHNLPEVFPEPSSFLPERFAPEAKAALPKGAYSPFGGGSRMCIGMRFGQLQMRTIATLLLSRFTFVIPDDFQLEFRKLPSLSPKNGLPVTFHPRAATAPADLATVA
jgi:cytochrome P450